MNDRQLRYALAVWRERSFSRAAEKLGVSQPSLSEQIRLLEGEVGFALFLRSSRGVEASTNGRTFLQHAGEVLVGMSALGDLARDLRGAPGVTVRIGIGSAVAQTIVPAVVAALPAGRPGVRLEVVTATTRRIQRLVDQQRLDVGLMLAPDPRSMPPELVREPLAASEVVAVVPPDHSLTTAETPLPLAALARHPLVASEVRIGYGQAVMAAFAAQGVAPDVAAVCDDIETLKLMVIAGAGIGLVPRLAADAEIVDGRLAVLALRPAVEAVLLFVRRPEPLPPRTEQALSRLAAALGLAERKAG